MTVPRKPERRRHRDEQRYPRAAFLEVGGLHRPVRNYRPLDVVYRLADARKALVADGSHGAARGAAQVFGPLDVAGLDKPADILHETLGIDFRERQVDDALYAKGKANDKGKGHQRHKPGTAFDKLHLKLLVQPSALFGHDLLHIGVGQRGVADQLCCRRVADNSRCRCSGSNSGSVFIGGNLRHSHRAISNQGTNCAQGN